MVTDSHVPAKSFQFLHCSLFQFQTSDMPGCLPDARWWKQRAAPPMCDTLVKPASRYQQQAPGCVCTLSQVSETRGPREKDVSKIDSVLAKAARAKID